MTISKFAFKLLAAFLILFGYQQTSLADSPAEFGNQYNLFVTDENRDQKVPLTKATEVLQGYFLEMPLKSDMQPSERTITQRELLLMFEMLKAQSKGESITLGDDELYYQSWLNARRHNWLAKAEITYKNLQEFLYRHQVSQLHANLPYHEGLVINDSEITADRFPNLPQVKSIQEKLLSQIRQLRLMGDHSEASNALEARLSGHYEAFLAAEEEIKRRESPINKIPNLPEDIKQKITENNLNQILEKQSYDYSHDAAYRQFNLTKGIMTINGRIFQPGENISFTRVLEEAPGGLSGYKMGWVIFGPKEELAYGGGLCGAATLFFTPSWRAGLEVVTRRGHSSYFSNLYPKESLGLDATIYFGSTDVVMKNNTDSPLLYYVEDNKEKKVVTLYVIGNSPYTNVEIEGPIKTGYHAYRFLRRLTQPDGNVLTQEINTRYSRIY